jgi:hypothetical protein
VISMDVIADSGCATVIPSPVMEIENLIRYAPCAVGYGMRSPPARARADYFFKDYKPSALQGEARLRVTRTPTVTLSTIGYRLSAIGYRLSAIGYRLSATISPRLWNAKPARADYTGLCIQRPL